MQRFDNPLRGEKPEPEVRSASTNTGSRQPEVKPPGMFSHKKGVPLPRPGHDLRARKTAFLPDFLGSCFLDFWGMRSHILGAVPKGNIKLILIKRRRVKRNVRLA
jgi:hypothetical protein